MVKNIMTCVEKQEDFFMDQFIRLPQAELEIMLIIWKAEGAVSSTYILEKFRTKREWALPTLMTVLTRLVNKGFITCTKEGRNNRYTATSNGDDYKRMFISDILKEMFDGSLEKLMGSLIEAGAITADDAKNAVKNL